MPSATVPNCDMSTEITPPDAIVLGNDQTLYQVWITVDGEHRPGIQCITDIEVGGKNISLNIKPLFLSEEDNDESDTESPAIRATYQIEQ